MKIKAKIGHNVIINDLKLTLRSRGGWVTISDKDYEKSTDIKKLSKYVIIQKDGVENTEVEKNETEVEKKEDNTEKVFVSEGRYYTNPDDVFVRMNPSEDIVEEKKVEAETEVEEKINDTVINSEEEVINNEEAVATIDEKESTEKDFLKEEQKIVEVTSIKENVDKVSKGTKSKNKSKTK